MTGMARWVKSLRVLGLMALVILSLAWGTTGAWQTVQAAGAYQYDENGKIKGCAWYRRYNGSWSKHYKVRGEIKTGAQMQQEMQDERFNRHTQYYLIRWKNGGYSALDIGPEGKPFVEGRTVTDQIGKTWNLSNGWDFCKNRR